MCSFEGLSPLIGSFDVIYNTVPAPVLAAETLAGVSGRTQLIDLASPPYGFDLTEARELGLDARRESGLPGRYCPMSAGIVQLDAFLNLIASEQTRSHEKEEI